VRLHRSRTLVLAYHRVARASRDPHLLCVAPDRFAEQMEYLHRQTDVIPMQGVRERGTGDRVAITFDDGYADNAQVARPILEGFGLPATFFITAGVVGRDGEFWWDRLENLLLSSSLDRGRLEAELNGHPISMDVSSEVERERAHAALHARLRRLPPGKIERFLDELTSELGSRNGHEEAHPVLSDQELLSLSNDLFEVGAHTISHPLLSAQSLVEQKTEISGGRRMLEGMVREEVRFFSYPFGGRDAFSNETVRLVQESGYVFACTGIAGRVSRRTHPLRLPRHFVHDWDRTEFAGRLSRWFANK
jgi:peptidoglycan/xylan/chitin deacetylase (PgdA/CDA1 family)